MSLLWLPEPAGATVTGLPAGASAEVGMRHGAPAAVGLPAWGLVLQVGERTAGGGPAPGVPVAAEKAAASGNSLHPKSFSSPPGAVLFKEKTYRLLHVYRC